MPYNPERDTLYPAVFPAPAVMKGLLMPGRGAETVIRENRLTLITAPQYARSCLQRNCSVMSRWSAFGLKIIKKLYQKIIKIYALDVILRHFFCNFFHNFLIILSEATIKERMTEQLPYSVLTVVKS